MTLAFAVTYDYRCPFARNAHEHVLDGLAAGADWEVTFVPFSLSQSKEPTWNRETDSGLLALELSVAVRDDQPDRFLEAHRALFGVRHDQSLSLRDDDVLHDALTGVGVDVDRAWKLLDDGRALATVREEHERGVEEHSVWGVPTFVAGDQAAFVRLMERPARSAQSPVDAIERLVAMLEGWPELNEFKHTSLPR
jgi:2-hydroxychromene-2-carboxylate isomerase